MGIKGAEEGLAENWNFAVLQSRQISFGYLYPAASYSERSVLSKSFLGEVDCEIFETGN